MKCKVLGLQRATGEYQGRNYDNYNLFVSYPKEHVVGEVAEKLKFKAVSFSEFCSNVGVVPKDLVGMTIDVSFNRYGQPETIDLA